VSSQTNLGSKVSSIDSNRYGKVKKIGLLPSPFIYSISVSAKHSIILSKYAEDFASVLRFSSCPKYCLRLSKWAAAPPQTICIFVKHQFRPDRSTLTKSEAGPQLEVGKVALVSVIVLKHYVKALML